MKRFNRIGREERGASALEFALVAPAFIFLLVGISQLGIFFFANAGLNNALAEGARFATLYPRPNETQIKARINASRFGLNPNNVTVSPLVYGTANSSPYADMSMSYTLQLNFIFIETDPITLTKSRRVYLQPTLS
ncbi:MAG TPA: TadE family protein [Allosphingosinicella sp.]|nr:TadE family protein [Allosphingosinicella sp.]